MNISSIGTTMRIAADGISAGFGPEDITRLRRFALGILMSFQKPAQIVAASMRKLCIGTRA